MFNFQFSGTIFCINESSTINIKRKDFIIHQCKICHYTTWISEHLKRHMQIHTGERPFACSSCSYRSTVKANLERHLILRNHKSDFI